MAWKECSVMDERLRFVAKLLEGETMTDACREFGISRKTGYKIFNRYKESGFESLSAHVRGPRVHARGSMHDRDVVVTACGRICLHRKRVNLSHVFAGQRGGIKESDEGIWIVSFMHYDLGFIDLEQKTLQPVDNPFGIRVSPMC